MNWPRSRNSAVVGKVCFPAVTVMQPQVVTDLATARFTRAAASVSLLWTSRILRWRERYCVTPSWEWISPVSFMQASSRNQLETALIIGTHAQKRQGTAWGKYGIVRGRMQ